MANPTEMTNTEGRFCHQCGEYLTDGLACPECGAERADYGEDEISISAHLTVLICSNCKKAFSIGISACPNCKDPASADEITDPREGPTNRAKLEALGYLLPLFQSTTSVEHVSLEEARVTLTDDQFLTFINEQNLISDALMEDIKSSLYSIDLSNDTAIRSTTTRQGFENFLKGTQQVRSTYEEIASARVPGKFEQLHVLILSAYRSILDLRLACAAGMLAITMEQVRDAQVALQAALDRAALAANMMSSELEAVDPDELGHDQLNRRVTAFVGQARQYDHRGQVDFAAALSAALGNPNDFSKLAHLGMEFFSTILPSDLEPLSTDQGATLFILAVSLASLDDPMRMLRQIRPLVELYREAFQVDPATMTEAMKGYEADCDLAGNHFLSLLDRFRIERVEQLPRDAERQELVDAYHKLAEWIYRPLVSLPLVAKRILTGNQVPFSRIQDMDFGEKLNELSQSSDPRFAPLLREISKVARNAAAHGDVDTSGALIRLRMRDRARRVTVEEVDDETFTKRLVALGLTCESLFTALGLLRVIYAALLPEPPLSKRRRVLEEVVRVVIGLFGLVGAKLSWESDPSVIIEAHVDAEKPVREPDDYLTAGLTLATLLPDWSEIELVVTNGSERHCRIVVPVAEVIAYNQVPKHAQTLALLKLIYCSTVEPSKHDGFPRLRQTFTLPGSRLLAKSLGEIQSLRNALPKGKAEFRQRVQECLDEIKLHSRDLVSIGPDPPEVSAKEDYLKALDLLKRGLSQHQKRINNGDWSSVHRSNYDLKRGGEKIVTFMQ